MIRNVIFDWSGTLVDDLPAVWEATNHVFRRAGIPEITLAEFRAEFALPFHLFYERYTPNLPPAQLEQWFHERFECAQDSVVELPHARQFLEFCRARELEMFVLSSVRPDHFETQAARLGLRDFFRRAYVGVWDKRDRIAGLLQENSLVPGETLFVGDMQHDIDTARHGGVHSCAVLTGYNGLEQLRAAAPDRIVEHLGELRAILERNAMRLGDLPSEESGVSPRQPVVTVGALVFDAQGRVLMVQTRKWSNRWGIPGGKIRYGEAAEAALRRELKEETGLEVADIEFVLVQDCIGSTEFYREAHFVLLNYTCVAAGSTAVQLNHEAQEFQWVSLEEALRLPLNQPTRVLAEAVLARRPQPVA